jgi:hypothetical protein
VPHHSSFLGVPHHSSYRGDCVGTIKLVTEEAGWAPANQFAGWVPPYQWLNVPHHSSYTEGWEGPTLAVTEGTGCLQR